MVDQSPFATFLASVQAGAPVPGDAALRGAWHALRGAWELAHDAVQDDSRECAWVHAALHHEEGDLANADYWYRRAGRTRPARSGREEYVVLAQQLVDG